MKTVDQVIAGLPKKEQVRINARAEQLVADEAKLQLRKRKGAPRRITSRPKPKTA